MLLYYIGMNNDYAKVCAIIVAAGESRRMNGKDKIMAVLGGKPLLAWSIEALQQSPLVHRIVIVNSQKNLETVRCMAIDNKWSKVIDVCVGGARRQDSVAAGLALLNDCEWVIIQDGARPFLTQEMIERGLAAAGETGAAIAAVPVNDTIKIAEENGMVLDTPPRNRLWAVQTPQIFRLEIIKAAYQKARGEVTDDASLVEMAGYKVKIFTGSYGNIKITTPHDLEMAHHFPEVVKESGK